MSVTKTEKSSKKKSEKNIGNLTHFFGGSSEKIPCQGRRKRRKRTKVQEWARSLNSHEITQKVDHQPDREKKNAIPDLVYRAKEEKPPES